MSVSCLYEFEDIVWDEFCQSDDHIVPHPGFERGDRHKKPCNEVTSISYSNKDRSSTGYVYQGSEKRGVSSLSGRKTRMLEKDLWTRPPTGVFPSSSDGYLIKEASGLASQNATSSSHVFKNNNAELSGNEFCTDDTILGNKTSNVDNNSSGDPLGDLTHNGNNLNFFENTEDIDSSNFLYYGWPEIENFEDVDRIFRSCDSTFGLGANKEDELDWFSSPGNIGGSGDVLKTDFKLLCPGSNLVENVSPNYDSSKSHSLSHSNMTNGPVSLEHSPWTSEKSDSYMPCVNGSAIAYGKEGFIPKAQMNEHQKQVKLPNQSEGIRKEHNFGNDCLCYISKVPNEVVQFPSRAISHQALSSVGVQQQQQQQALGSDSCNYLPNHIPYVHSDISPLSDLTSVNPTSSAVKSESNNLTSLSTRYSSQVSNQLPSMDDSNDSSLPVTAPMGTGNKDKLHNHQGTRLSVDCSLKRANAAEHATLDDPGSISKEAQYPGTNSEYHSDIEGGSHSIPSELGSSNILESSTMGSGMDDISLEAASFRQLQLVMEQLDLRTKICIRDSLYRLARTAELRHDHSNSNGSCGDGRNASGTFITEGENNFMDIETDTNPIDRSVAHLLFHRPPESSSVPAHDSVPFKPPSTIRGSVTSPCVVAEDLNNSEDKCF